MFAAGRSLATGAAEADAEPVADATTEVVEAAAVVALSDAEAWLEGESCAASDRPLHPDAPNRTASTTEMALDA
jgi:hypothetical protein